MDNTEYRTYRYRWIILFVFSLITALIELQWLTFAPIAREARLYYHASTLEIDLLSMIYMGVFLVMCLPASYVLDTYGLRIGVGLGAVFTFIFSLMKGIFGDNYVLVVVAQTGLAIAQPLIINAPTKVAVQWFPLRERATAVGLATLSQFIGIVVAMIVTPLLLSPDDGGAVELKPMLLTYGIIAAAGALVLLALWRERPPTPPGFESETNHLSFKQGLRHTLAQRDIRLILALFFIGLGVFNALSTCIDQICQPKGLIPEQTGLVGGLMLIAGIVGGVVLPLLSDRFRKRKAFIAVAMIGMTPGLIGLTFTSSYPLLLAASSVLGFFLLGAGGPIGFQYAAEVSHPAPESTVQGFILFVGQASGISFTILFNLLGTTPAMILFTALSLINIGLSLFLRESPLMATGGKRD